MNFVMSHRVLVTVVVMFVTVAALSVLPQAVIRSSLEAVFFGEDHPEFSAYKQRVAEFGSDEVFLFGIEVDDPLSEQTIAQLQRFHDEVEQNPKVKRVQSVANLERVGLVGETIGVRRFSELAAQNPGSKPELLEEIRGDPIAGGLFVSREHPDVLVLVENIFDSERPAEEGPVYVAELRGALERAGFPPDSIHAGGLMSTLAAMMVLSRETLAVMFPLVSLALLLCVYLMFGRLWPVIVTTASALIAVLWTVAFSILQEPTINILMSILPTFVMIISFSDVVHICSAYLLNLEAGESKNQAIANATTEVGAACMLTSITTGVGFYALTFVPAPAFENLGLAAAFGVIIAYVLAMVIVPVMLLALPTPSDWHQGRVGFVQDAIDRLLDWLCDVTTKRPWPIIALFVAITAFLGWAASQVNIETDFAKRLSDDNPARIDQKYISDRFTESTIIDVYIETPAQGGIIDAQTFNDLIAFEKEVESWPEVERMVSIVDLMRATHRSVVGADAPFGPFDDAALAQLMILLEMPGPDSMSSIVDFQRQTGRFTVYTNVQGVVGQFALQERIEAAGRSVGGGVSIEATGIGPLLGGWLDDILAGQRRGLGFSMLTIMLLLVLGFRSIRAGVVSMVPNVIPLLAAGAWCGLFWEQTDSDTLIVAMIAIGIGVDDTIHFIARFQTESRRRERMDAIRETFRYSGRGIFITTFVFAVGFMPAMTSDYTSIYNLGLLLPVCFVVALIADLLFVPALCAVGLIK